MNKLIKDLERILNERKKGDATKDYLMGFKHATDIVKIYFSLRNNKNE